MKLGSVERLTQIFKRQVSFMRVKLYKIFNLYQAKHAVVRQLRICRQKTTSVNSFEAHLVRDCNTQTSNIATADSQNHTNKNYQSLFRWIYCTWQKLSQSCTVSQYRDLQWSGGGKVLCAATSEVGEQRQQAMDEAPRLWLE